MGAPYIANAAYEHMMRGRQDITTGECVMSEATPQKYFEEDKLAAWMADQIEGFEGPISVDKFPGGQSNPTFKISTEKKNYVLRRKPPGQLLKGAHAVDREHRIISALGTVGFPVPKTYALCQDPDVMDADFYIMDMVEGRIFWDTSFPEVPTEDRRKYFDAMNDTIARLHNVDYEAIGLGDYGRPGNYFERQIGRWSKQYLQDEIAGRVPEMDNLVEWLPKNIPAGDETTLVHGDYRCDNMIFHPTEPRVIAVLDWELSTLGHPIGDFTYHLMAFRMPKGLSTSLSDCNFDEMNIPTEEEYVQAYCERTGRSGIDNLDFYLAFNMFRLAAIIHGVKGRMLKGNASNAKAAATAARLEPLAKAAWAQAEAAMKKNG